MCTIKLQKLNHQLSKQLGGAGGGCGVNDVVVVVERVQIKIDNLDFRVESNSPSSYIIQTTIQIHILNRYGTHIYKATTENKIHIYITVGG